MNEARFHVKNPLQVGLAGEEVLEITLRVGVINDSNHVQFQLDVIEAHTGKLLSLESRLHVPLEDSMQELSHWIQRLQEEVWDCTGPF